MSRARMGELLGRMGKLSSHDIDEILQEQSSHSGRRFGEIALTWGLIEPEHIWQAWCEQLSDGFTRIDLAEIGIDAQATDRLPRELAERFCAMPLRLLDDQVIIAISDPAHASLFDDLHDLFQAKPKFVVADAEQIRVAIRRYYTPQPEPRAA